MSISTIPIQLMATFQVFSGRQIGFPATPKEPDGRIDWKGLAICLSVMLILIFSLVNGTMGAFFGREGFTASMVIVNVFWVGLLMLIVVRTGMMTVWSPHEAILAQKMRFAGS